MQAPRPIFASCDLIARGPTVGGLMGLCEESYRILMRLAPGLPGLRGTFESHDDGGFSLLLDVHEQAPFTTIFRLTYLFAGPGGGRHPEPDATLRAYHDAGQVEVLSLRQTALPVFNHYRSPALQAKWNANLFLSKWLRYCVSRGHRFPPSPNCSPPVSRRELMPAT